MSPPSRPACATRSGNNGTTSPGPGEVGPVLRPVQPKEVETPKGREGEPTLVERGRARWGRTQNGRITKDESQWALQRGRKGLLFGERYEFLPGDPPAPPPDFGSKGGV